MTATRRTLGSVLRIKHGYAFPGEEFSDDPAYPTLVTPGNFAIGGGFKEGRPKTFVGDFPSEYELAPGDLIVTMTDLSKAGDTLGLPAIVPSDRSYLHNQRVGLVEITAPNLADAGFLSYYLRTAAYRSHVIGTASGSTVRHTSPSRIGAFEALLPSLPEQQAIAEVLGALDDKIAANARTISFLREIAATAFNGLMEGSLEQTRLSDVLTLEYGKALPAARREIGDVDVYGSGGITGAHNEALRRGPGVVVGRKGTAGAVYWSANDYYPIDTTYYAVPTRASVPMTFCYFLLRGLGLSDMNSDSAVPGLNRNEAHALPVRVPGDDALAEFDEFASLLLKQVRHLELENQVLAATRDALLPELMSGRLRVRDAESAVEAQL